jgi:excisionase family DNA binding protein
MSELRDLMTPKQVAGYLQLHPLTIYRYISEGRLAAAKIGGRYRIRRETVEKLLADMKRPEQAVAGEQA